MKKEYLAKSGEPIITVKKHTSDVGESAEKLFKLYNDVFTENEKALIKLACKYHDYGKINDLFQGKITKGKRNISGEIAHGVLSCMFIDVESLKEKGFEHGDIQALITAIIYHHTRSIDFRSFDAEEYLENYLEEAAIDYFGEDVFLDYDNINERLFTYNESLPSKYNYEKWLKYLVIKGILNKADYNASNLSKLPMEIPHVDRMRNESSLTELVESVMTRNIPGKQFDDILYPAQKFLRENQGENIILVAPAGSGKTEGSLLWLGERKGFYTLPLKVSSNAIYKRIKNTYDFDRVALLHSDALSQYLIEENGSDMDEKMKQYEVMKGLSYPLTVCTVDQIFKFVFKSLGTEIFAATLKYSCVIIDEIQMYSPKMMAFLCYGIKVVNDLGGKFLIMTATLPSMVEEYLENEGIKFKKQKYIELNSGVRHRIKVKEQSGAEQVEIDYNLVLEQAKEGKVLVLCNTIKQAQKVYEALINNCDNISVQLLHSNFTKRHREILENEIMSFAGKGAQKGNGIWISTQIVEASLDIDFDFLHTEMCTIDALFQRMGRCYRSRSYEGEMPNVFIYDTKNGRAKVLASGESRGIYDTDIYDYSLTEVAKYDGKCLAESDKMEMIEEVFNYERLKETTYFSKFKKEIEKMEKICPAEISKSEGDYYFREINAVTVIPDVLYRNQSELFEEWIENYESKSLGLEEKQKYKNKILEECLSLSKYYGRLPKTVDKDSIKVGAMGIHRCQSVYDFNEELKTGKGLVLDEWDETDQFI